MGGLIKLLKGAGAMAAGILPWTEGGQNLLSKIPVVGPALFPSLAKDNATETDVASDAVETKETETLNADGTHKTKGEQKREKLDEIKDKLKKEKGSETSQSTETLEDKKVVEEIAAEEQGGFLAGIGGGIMAALSALAVPLMMMIGKGKDDEKDKEQIVVATNNEDKRVHTSDEKKSPADLDVNGLVNAENMKGGREASIASNKTPNVPPSVLEEARNEEASVTKSV